MTAGYANSFAAALRICSTSFDSHVCNGGSGFFHAQFFCLEIAVVEAVQAGSQCRSGTTASAPSASRSSTRWLLAAGRNLTRISPTIPTLGFLHIRNGDVIKFLDDLTADLLELAVGRIAAGR